MTLTVPTLTSDRAVIFGDLALTFDQLSGITQTKMLPKLVDNLFNSNAFLKKLKARL